MDYRKKYLKYKKKYLNEQQRLISGMKGGMQDQGAATYTALGTPILGLSAPTPTGDATAEQAAAAPGPHRRLRADHRHREHPALRGPLWHEVRGALRGRHHRRVPAGDVPPGLRERHIRAAEEAGRRRLQERGLLLLLRRRGTGHGAAQPAQEPGL